MLLLPIFFKKYEFFTVFTFCTVWIYMHSVLWVTYYNEFIALVVFISQIYLAKDAKWAEVPMDLIFFQLPKLVKYDICFSDHKDVRQIVLKIVKSYCSQNRNNVAVYDRQRRCIVSTASSTLSGCWPSTQQALALDQNSLWSTEW